MGAAIAVGTRKGLFATDADEGIHFGTRSGFVYARRHDGPRVEAARHLPPVLSTTLRPDAPVSLVAAVAGG